MKTLLSAAYIATMTGPIIRDGAVAFDEHRIIAVGQTKTIRGEHPDANPIDLGQSVILPGLINAHTHLELSALGQLPKPASFVDWILNLREKIGAITDFPGFIADSVKAGIQQCLRFGVTAVGDITLNPVITRPLLAAAEMRGVSFGEVLGMANRIDQLDSRLAAAIDQSTNRPFFRAGIEPHAPYSLDLVGYKKCLEAARPFKLPLSTHLAETPDEAPFLTDHTGPFRRLWETLGAWSEGVSRAAGGPIRAMRHLGLLDYPTLLAHVNYIDDSELEILARSQASVVYCPRTHAYFNHPPHRFEEMSQRGINVAIGTDSAASSTDLNIVDDVRLVYLSNPDRETEFLWSLITSRAAIALGMSHMIGQLATDRLPDLCVFEIRSNDPLKEILENTALPTQVWRSGRRAFP